MKEPSELDIALLRDLCTKFAYLDPVDTGYGNSCRINLSPDHTKERSQALRRFLDHYEYMSEEISRLVLEKHRVD